ncbi:MAG: dihydrofolate reductase, partial [Planctomycetota bacterium]
MERPLSLIVAASDNDVIGREGQLPWRLSADLRRFKRLTMGHHLIMGRKTFESIGRPLPGRTTIVLSRQRDYAPAGVVVAHSPEEVLKLVAADSEPFVVGGAEIYRLLLPWVGKIYLTRVHCFI